MRQVEAGATASSRATTRPRDIVSRSSVTVVVDLAGGLFGSGGGTSASRSSKSNRLAPGRAT